MRSSSIFPSLCKELSQIQVNLLQRSGNPIELALKGLSLLKDSKCEFDVTADAVPYVPVFLRSCATILDLVPEADHLNVLDTMQGVHRVASQYVSDHHGDVNEASKVLNSLLGLDKCQRRIFEKVPATKNGETQRFAGLLRPCYSSAYNKWTQQHTTPVNTLSVLSLLRGTAVIHASDFLFSPPQPNQRGLLPLKNRVQMEAKMQRCPGSRELVNALKSMAMNRLDAGMCLVALAELGFYDTDLCNLSCEVLHSSHAVVTSQQFSQVLYSLGVLQHRHVYQRFFSSLIVPKQCTAQGICHHVLGLAMLQQPPHSEKSLLDGVFLHALRSSHSSKQKSGKQVVQENRSNEKKAGFENELPYTWYVDVGYGLSCLDISHHKFKLMEARAVRGPLRRMSTAERCKVLYSLGPPHDAAVPSSMKDNWEKKVVKALSFAAHLLETIEVSDGPQVMHALRYCGYNDHPRIPQAPTGGADIAKDNPVDVLLQTWAQSPKERIIHLAEQIESSQLHTGSNGTPAAQLAKVVSALVRACPSPSPREQYRFASLCAALEQHVDTFSVEETLSILAGLRKLELSQHYEETVMHLLNRLWALRENMSGSQRLEAEELMRQHGDNERAARLGQ